MVPAAMTPVPSQSVLEAFAVDGRPLALDGGEGVSFRVGDVVLKRVHDQAETEWTQDLLSRVEQVGFRLADPIATTAGAWVHDDWCAGRFIDGLRPAAPAWDDIADAGLRFADAAERVRDGGGEVLAARTHRWAIADRVAWDEAQVELDPDAVDVMVRLTTWLRPGVHGVHFVHADLSGNVFIDPAGVPVVLDVSPYLRPRRWAVAVVVADAVLWNGADLELAESFAASATDRDLLGRALIFRLVAEQLARDPRHGAFLEPYFRVLARM
jgi:uncharacterized protein (TIGR02569 family)